MFSTDRTRLRGVAVLLVSATLSLTLGVSPVPAQAERLVDGKDFCVGMRAVRSPNSLSAVSVNCASQKHDFLRIGALGEIRSGAWCLGIAQANPEPGVSPSGSINWSRCIGTTNLMWSFDGSQIKSRMHGYCLARASAVEQGALMYQMQRCDGGKRQQWRLR